MKKLLLFPCLFLFYNANSQLLNYASHTGIDLTSGIISINSKSYYQEDIQGYCCSKSLMIVGVNATGQILFKKNLNSSFDFFKKMIKTSDKSILVVGTSLAACDIGGAKNFIAKLDTNGTVLFRNFITSASVMNHDNISDIIEYPDSTFYLSTDTLLLHYSNTGQYLSESSPGLKDITTLQVLPNGNILINGKQNNTLTNFEYDPINFTIINQQSASFSLSKFEKLINGNVVALSNSGQVLSYTSALNFINTASGLTMSGIKVSDFISRNDSVFVTGYNSVTELPFYGILNSGLNVIYSSPQGYKRVKPTGISITNRNRINIISTGASSVAGPVTFTGLYQFGISNGFKSTRDVGVISIGGINPLIKYSNGYYIPTFDLEATVKNFGTDTVKSFYLNNYYYPNYCYGEFFHKLYAITIAPGDTVRVQTGSYTIQTSLNMVPGSQPGTIKKIALCLFTTAPDFSNDIDIMNDAKCDSVMFTLTGIKETQLDASEITLFPNPFQSSFHLKSDYQIVELELTGAIGVVIRAQRVDKKECEVMYEDLPDGIYFLKIKTEKGIAVKKIIKN